MISRKIMVFSVALVLVAATLGGILLLNKPVQNNTNQEFIDQSGSTTMYELALSWTAAYEEDNKMVQINVTEPGSAVGIAELLDRKADIADASRQMNAVERANGSAQGMNILEIPVALDGISMIVNPYLYNNNITTLTLDQLKALYNGSITNWKDLGGPDTPVLVYGRKIPPARTPSSSRTS